MNVHEGVLGEERCQLLLELLSSPEVKWARPSGRFASRGNTLQLAGPEEHDRAAMVRVSTLVLAGFFPLVENRACIKNLPRLSPQVFPVHMEGSRENPPYQEPHVDSAILDGRRTTPLVTIVYYAAAEGLLGGELVLFEGQLGDHREVERIEPVVDRAVVLPGATLHAVAPLFKGRRISVVLNIYSSIPEIDMR